MSENFSRLGTLTIIMKSGAPKQYLKIKKTFVKWLASKFHYQGNKIMLTSMKQLHSLIFFSPSDYHWGEVLFSCENTLYKVKICKGLLFDTPLFWELWCPGWYDVVVNVSCLLEKQRDCNNKDFQMHRWRKEQQKGNQMQYGQERKAALIKHAV